MDVVEEIKRRIDIVDFVSEFVPLKKVGKYYRGLCPFHSEKHPSFYVMPDHQRWHCFGACSTGGDIFSFVMRRENLSFSEALRLLAQKAGIKLEAFHDEKKEDKRLYQINEAAASFYHNQLLHSNEALYARSYLKDRGILLNSVLSFGLGYSPREGRALKNHLSSLGFSQEEAIKSGLVREEGFDLFRGRLMFPIADVQGRVIGFGARSLDDTPPKYLNSPSTPIFEKGSILYGLDKARESIRKENKVILVEGYIDVIIAHQYGFKNVLGTLGVALTEKQFHLLKNYTRNIILALDMDRAGVEAVLRGIETVGNVMGEIVPIPDWRGMVRYENLLGCEISVVALPEGKDPDEVIREGKWEELISKTVPVIDFLIDTLSLWHDLSELGGRVAFLEKLKPIFQQIKDPIKWSYYVQKLARRLNIEERILADAFRVSEEVKGVGESSYSPIPRSLEEECLAFLLPRPHLREKAQIPPQYFLDTVNREIFNAWKACPEPDLIERYLPKELHGRLNQILRYSLPDVEGEERVLEQCIIRLRENFLRYQIKLEGEVLTDKGIAVEGLRRLLKGRGYEKEEGA